MHQSSQSSPTPTTAKILSSPPATQYILCPLKSDVGVFISLFIFLSIMSEALEICGIFFPLVPSFVTHLDFNHSIMVSQCYFQFIVLHCVRGNSFKIKRWKYNQLIGFKRIKSSNELFGTTYVQIYDEINIFDLTYVSIKHRISIALTKGLTQNIYRSNTSLNLVRLLYLY